MEAQMVRSVDAARPDVVDATASAARRHHTVDVMSEARSALGVGMQQPIRIRVALIDQTLQRSASDSRSLIRSVKRETVVGCERLVEVAQHDDLLHPVRPAEQLGIQLVSERSGWRSSSLVVQPRWHVGGDDEQLVALERLEDGAEEAASLGPLVGAAARGEGLGDQQGHACFLLRGASRADEQIVGQLKTQQGRVADLLQCDDVE